MTQPAQAVDQVRLMGDTSAYDWSGLYAGVHFSVGTGKLRSSIGTNTAESSFDGGDHDSGGALIGWNTQYQNIVFGLESAISINEIKNTYKGGFLPYHTSDYVWHAEARARVGYNAGQFLPFVSAGLVAGEFYQQSGANSMGPTGDLNSVFGYTLGAGMDMQLSKGFALRGEYIYQNFGNSLYRLSSVPTTLKTDFDVHLGRVALLYHFDNPVSASNPNSDDLFSGPSLGLNVGLSTGETRLNGYARGSMQAQSLTGGIKVGYLFPINKFRIGGEASLNLHSGSNNFDPNGAVDDFDYRLMWHATLQAKLGYVHEQFMPYVAAGASLGQFTARAQPNNNTTLEPFKNGFGVVGGMEYAASERVSVDMAYGYNMFKNTSINTSGHTTKIRHGFHQVRLGLVVR